MRWIANNGWGQINTDNGVFVSDEDVLGAMEARLVRVLAQARLIKRSPLKG